jgi:dihydrofolate reductase
MWKIVVTEFVSLDGVIEAPTWSAPYWNDEIANFKAEEQNNSEALLLGRVTYQMFAGAWPQSQDAGAAFMNSVPKYVVSTTLNEDKLEWNNSRLVKDDVVEEISQLKQQAGKDLLVYGSGRLLQTLIEHDLVDHLRLLVYPVVLGKGQRLFSETTTATLKLVQAQTLSSGVLALIYEPQR